MSAKTFFKGRIISRHSVMLNQNVVPTREITRLCSKKKKNVTHNQEKNCSMEISPTFHHVDVWQKNHADVWQKPRQFSKAFILQLKNKLKKKSPPKWRRLNKQADFKSAMTHIFMIIMRR